MHDAPPCSCGPYDRRLPSLLLDNPVRRLVQPPGRFLSRHLRPGDHVADLGCGPGHFTVAMTRVVGERGRVHAVDFDPKAVARLKHKAERHGVDHLVDARVASVAEIDFIDSSSLDFVLAEAVLCCMTDHTGAMRQIARILRPTGKAWLSVMKGARAGDPRSVGREEWASLLSRMRVHASGHGLLSRWALVSPPERITVETGVGQ